MRLFRLLVRVIGDRLRGAIVAFQFLSRLPVPFTVSFNSHTCRRSVLFFPLVGFVLGWLLLLGSFAFTAVLPPLASAVLLTAIWIAFSGGLHLDGWIDTADGMFSHRSRDRILDIMRDSRVGAMGVIAAIMALLLKVSLVHAILSTGIELFAFYIVLVPVWSRWFMVTAIAVWPGASRNGVGTLFAEVRLSDACASFITALLCSLAVQMTPFALDNNHFWLATMLLIVVTVLGGSMLCAFLARKLGGLTGDTYGASNEAVELLLLVGAWIAVTSIYI